MVLKTFSFFHISVGSWHKCQTIRKPRRWDDPAKHQPVIICCSPTFHFSRFESITHRQLNSKSVTWVDYSKLTLTIAWRKKWAWQIEQQNECCRIIYLYGMFCYIYTKCILFILLWKFISLRITVYVLLFLPDHKEFANQMENERLHQNQEQFLMYDVFPVSEIRIWRNSTDLICWTTQYISKEMLQAPYINSVRKRKNSSSQHEVIVCRYFNGHGGQHCR